MKKLLCGSLIALGLISGANATDLISLATNGKANESSLGVKALSNQEMNEIVGGAYVNRKFIKQYGVVNNSGQNIRYTAYYPITLENYIDSIYINLLPNEIGAVETTYNFRTNKISVKIVAINKNDYIHMRDLYKDAQTRINNLSNVSSWIKSDKANIKYFR
ncbi:hypothetical protein [Helicobacter valdiviensis]|nr:hypothetical protein [Helicobacter valdiviensis]